MTRFTFDTTIASFLLITIAATTHGHAAVVTSPDQLSPTSSTLDFEAFPDGPTMNPLIIDGVIFSSSTPLAIVDITGFGADGPIVFRKTLRSNGNNSLGDPGYTDIRIDFASSVSEVGLGWFDPNFSGNRLEAYDVFDVLLESTSIPTGPEGGSFAAFRGFSRSQNDVSYVVARVSNANDVFSIDNVVYTTAVPEPSSLSLLCIAATGLLIYRQRCTRTPKTSG